MDPSIQVQQQQQAKAFRHYLTLIANSRSQQHSLMPNCLKDNSINFTFFQRIEEFIGKVQGFLFAYVLAAVKSLATASCGKQPASVGVAAIKICITRQTVNKRRK